MGTVIIHREKAYVFMGLDPGEAVQEFLKSVSPAEARPTFGYKTLTNKAGTYIAVCNYYANPPTWAGKHLQLSGSFGYKTLTIT